MTPEQLARDAIRVTARAEAQTVRYLNTVLTQIERDAKALVSALPLRSEANRAIIELQTRQIIEQSRAAQDLLALGSDTGPLATATRQRILQSYQHGLETAQAAAVATGAIDAATAANVLAFGPRVDVEFINALASTTITTLENVTTRALETMERELVRVAVSGAGPRAAGRAIANSIGIARWEGERIARTTFMNANNVARERMYEDLGVEYVQANAANDERTCEYCESRHGMVYTINEAPQYPLHPNCRCVTIPWSPRTPPGLRGDAYYERTRAGMAERREEEGRAAVRATTPGPFERANDIEPPKPIWAPGRGFL